MDLRYAGPDQTLQCPQCPQCPQCAVPNVDIIGAQTLRLAATQAETTMTGAVDMVTQYTKLFNNVEPMGDGVDSKYQSQTELQFGTIDHTWTQREIDLYRWASELEKEAAKA
jgi:hypothetical protein